MCRSPILNVSQSIVIVVLSLAVSRVGVAQHDHGAENTFDPLSNPNQTLVSYYAKNKGDIDKLSAAARDQSTGQQQRVDALAELRLNYPDPAVSVSVDLLKDSSTEVAANAVQIVADAAVMMDHKMSSTGAQTPSAKYLMAKHATLLDALRSAVGDKRKEVRKPAAELLASQSDAPALEEIAIAAKKGVCSDAEAVLYFSLADPSKSGPYLSPYLENHDEEVQAKAAGRLAYAPNYKDTVKENILLNSDASVLVREAAAKGLATDPTVAYLLLDDSNTPSSLKAVVADVYFTANGDKLSPKELQSFDRYLDGVQQRQPDVKLDNIKQRVNRKYQEKSK